MDSTDRATIEAAYLTGDISVICCTSTLAAGVNLPCHLAIIKGTSTYQGACMIDYIDLEIIQMLGRAGRPQFDDNAIGIIMTKQGKVQHYQNMLSGQQILESW